MGLKPLYVVKLDGKGYYHSDARWDTVPREQAELFTHKEAHKLANWFRSLRRTARMDYTPSVEPA